MLISDSGVFWDVERLGLAGAVETADGKTVSYRDLIDWADRIVADCPARSLVAIRCTFTPAALAAYLGCLRRGLVPLLLDRDMPDDQVAEILQRYQIAFLWDDSNPNSVTHGVTHGVTHDVTHGVTHDVTHGGDFSRVADVSPTLHPDLAVLVCTSGSSGRPRCVRLSYANITSNAAAIASYLNLTPADRPLLTLPWSSAFGLSVIHSHWAVGATVLLPAGSIVERSFWDQFRTRAATSLAGVPFTFAQLKRLRLERLNLPSLRLLLQAGGRLSPELVQYFADLGQELGYRFFVMYGQTEATARMAYLQPELAAFKPTSIGRPIPGGTLTVRDSNGRPQTEPGQVGELFYRGPNVMLGYADSAADLALGSVNDGEIGTGDLGYCDADGDFYVAGRLTRFVKLEGKRIHLDALEQTLHDWGYEALAVGDDSQVTVAVRPLREAAEPMDQLKSRLASHFRVTHQWFILQRLLEIPYLSNGKVDYWSFAARHARAAHAQ
ncbi:MAG: AMP-binding protein [Pirellulaceae bacterium]|nr:AMP-binding protein [Pirellulaceae bacterium]